MVRYDNKIKEKGQKRLLYDEITMKQNKEGIFELEILVHDVGSGAYFIAVSSTFETSVEMNKFNSFIHENNVVHLGPYWGVD